LTRYPGDVTLASEFAEAATAQKNWTEAVQRWQAVLEAGGTDAPARAYLRLGQALRAEGELAAAEAILGQALTRYPGDVTLASEFAEAATAQKNWTEAAKRWRDALDFSSGQAPPEINAHLGRALRLTGRTAEARAVLLDGLVTHPRHMRLLSELALSDTSSQRYENAQDALWGEKDLKVEIVVCVHNALEEVERCLQSIRTHTTFRYCLTIIDDASASYVSQFLNAFVAAHSCMRVIRNAENCGYTRSANRGLRESRSEWAVLLNSDTIVTAGWLEGLIECAVSGTRIAAVGPLSNAATFQSVPETRQLDGSFVVNELPTDVTPDDAAEIIRSASVRAFPRVPMLNGFCMLLSLSAIKELGYLDEVNFPIGYGEENDLCLRLVSAGYKLAIADHVYVYHGKSASFGASRKALIERSMNALQSKWPAYSYSYVADGIENLPCMLELRSRLRTQLASHGSRKS
jgi:GT2 family glycosyltransferase